MMFRAVVWSAAIVTVGAVAIFVPIDPAVLERVGFIQTRATPTAAPVVAPVARPGSEPESRTRSIAAALGDSQLHALSAKTAPADVPARPRRGDTEGAAARAIVAGSGGEPPATTTRSASLDAAPASLPGTAAPSPFAAVRRPPPPAAEAGVAATRALQSELKRLGCYHGAIDGDWGPASRYAAALFTKAVNAALPTEQPDTILLALARQHVGAVCRDGAASAVITAATMGRPNRSLPAPVTRERSNVGPAANHAARMVPAPRIVSADGAIGSNPAGADIIQIRPPLTSGDGAPPRMSLGAEAPAAEEQTAEPITRAPSRDDAEDRPEQQVRERRIQRVERDRRRASRRARSRKWQREVFQAVDLSGS